MTFNKVTGEEILIWRKQQLLKGGRSVDLDWLLDISGGLSWTKLQELRIDPSRLFILDKSLDCLTSIWFRHLRDQAPLQYLVGRCPWRDFELEVNHHVLIPRQETEVLIDLAIAQFQDQPLKTWADLGTGSGALAIALARAFPMSEGRAVDFSQDALILAKRNLNYLVPQSKVSLHLGSWWKPLRGWWGQFDLVLANPPYIPSSVLETLDPIVREHEPHLALNGGTDGLNACREIVHGAVKGLASGGWLILEHHHDQSESVLDLMTQSGLEEPHFEKDLNGVRRFALCRNP